MQSKLKFYDRKDWLSWVVDFIISKLNFFVTPDYRQKKNVYGKLLERGFDFEKITSTTFDFIGSINDRKQVFRCRIFESDFQVLEQIVFCEEYSALVRLIQEENYQPSVLIDCGANTGYTSIYLSSFFNFKKVIAVEPSAKTFEILSWNLNRLNQHESIVLEKKGIWSSTTFLSGNTSFRDGRAWSFSLKEDKERGDIPVVGISDLIEKNSLYRIDILKLDIEGGEAAVFKDEEGIKKVLAITKYIAIEIHDEFDCRDQIEKVLGQCGFVSFKSGELLIGSNKYIQ